MEEYWQGKREWRTDGSVLAGEKGKFFKKNFSQCHFFLHKSHKDCPGIEPVPRGYI
jgi:hypothetical protein